MLPAMHAALRLARFTLLSTLTAIAALAAGDASAQPAVRLGGVDHIALTVSNVNASEAFFTRTLGFTVERRDPEHPAVTLTNGHVVLMLYRVADLGTEVPFDRKRNVGLHHLAFEIGSFEELATLYAQLERVPGVVVEFPPEPLGAGPAKHMIIREPGGNRLEFIHQPKSAARLDASKARFAAPPSRHDLVLGSAASQD